MPIYLWLNIFLLLVPVVLSFHKKIHFFSKWKFAVPAIILSSVFFITWDVFFTWLGVWRVNPEQFTGVALMNVPLEQLLLYFSAPFAFLFLHEILPFTHSVERFSLPLRLLLWFVFFLNLLLILLYYDRIYTLYTGLGTCFTILVLLITRHIRYTGAYILCWMVCLIPITLVCGIFASFPVIEYNKLEVSGFSLFSVPAEDLLFTFLFFLVNTAFYEGFKGSSEHIVPDPVKEEPAL
jgi:lycopene cyclase domain-containing protein